MREEAKRLQARYEAKGISRDARRDINVVADFDGTTASQLGQPTGANQFRVFVFGRTGELLAEWNDVPNSEQLTAILKMKPVNISGQSDQ
jgi:hypothetical protein